MSWLEEESKKEQPMPSKAKLVAPVKKTLTANPPHGNKGDFVRMTVTMPPEVYELLSKEVTRRKVAKATDPTISAILREAAVSYLSKQN
jgi:transcriptional regulator of met regulon